MIKKILLDESELRFGVVDLPCLIHGKDKAGASLFTVTLVASLYAQGKRMVFLSGYPMARDELIEQIGKSDDLVIFDPSVSIDKVNKSRAVFILKDEVEYFPKIVKGLIDIDEWVVLIKNIDLFSEREYRVVENHKKSILSGNLDKCSYKDLILKREFESRVFFSECSDFDVPRLNKYKGYFVSREQSGSVKVVI